MVKDTGTTATPKKTRTRTPKAARLKALADIRVPRAVKAIRLVGDLKRYQPTTPQQDQMLAALRTAVDEASTAFSAPVTEPTAEFKLSIAA